MIGNFATATQVHRRPGSTDTHAVYDAEIAKGWDIVGNANGGYLMALAARAMGDLAERPPLSVTAHFISPGKVGAVTIEVEAIRVGRTLATMRANVLNADGKPVISVIGAFSGPRKGTVQVIAATPPVLPPADECIRTGPPPGSDDVGFRDRIIGRYPAEQVEFRYDRPTGKAEISGWFEFADHSPIDEYGLLLAADAFPPVCFNLDGSPRTWAPTLEMTVYLRGLPAPGPLRARFFGVCVQGGMFDEQGELWDSEGQLVAHSRQLALLPR